MKVSDYIAQRLSREGITHAFLVQGAANNDLIYSIADAEGIEYVCAQHEQGAGFMAEGWAKAKNNGTPGLAIATSGPGGQNLVTPIANCFYDSVPAIFITGQVHTKFMRKSNAIRQLGFQEWPIVDVVRPITKYAAEVTDPKTLPGILERSLWTARSPRRGPVLLDIPLDVQKAEITPEGNLGIPQSVYLRPDLSKLIEDLKTAQRPVFLIGGGCQESRRQIEQLGEILKVPMFPTWNALDVVTSDLPMYGGRIGTYGGSGRNFGLQNADLVIAVGSRISGRITGGDTQSFTRNAKRYYVDIDQGLLDPNNQPVKAHENIYSPASIFLEELEFLWRLEINERRVPDWSTWRSKVFEWRDRYDPVKSEFYRQKSVHPYAFIRRLSEALPSNAIIVSDCGGNAVVMSHAFQTKKGQRFFSNHGNSPMGFAFCGALGAWFSQPERPIVCVIGDGGFQLNIQELQTLVHYGANVKVFILNNGVYGITKAYQATNMGGRFEACGPRGYSTPDFEAVCKAYGVGYLSVVSNDSTAVMGACNSYMSFVCEVECPEFHTYEPRISGWSPIEDMSPKLPREEFEENMAWMSS